MMSPLLHQIAHVLEPWKSLFADSSAISTTVTVVHLLALLFAGGLAIAADRATLRIRTNGGSDPVRHLSELHAVHRPVLIALGLLVVSGVLLAAADVETYAISPVFWVKMGLIVLLLANGMVLSHTEAALRGRLRQSALPNDRNGALWHRLRVSAIASVALWTATLVAGAILVNA